MEKIVCDSCGEDLYDISILGSIKREIKVNRNGIDYDFCNLQCLLQWILIMLKQEKETNKKEKI